MEKYLLNMCDGPEEVDEDIDDTPAEEQENLPGSDEKH